MDKSSITSGAGQPLREAVSWNDEEAMGLTTINRQPLREAVSWNFPPSGSFWPVFSQPLREAVSWNFEVQIEMIASGKSASSWGCELKYLLHILFYYIQIVSLFVRLLVEITVEKFSMSDIRCQPLREAVSWNMTCDTLYLTTRSSVSSWGCKLKYEQSYGYKFRITGNCRENFAWKNSVNGIVQCLRPVRNDHGFVALLYGSGHRSCLLLPRHGRTTAMKYVRNRCRW